MSKCTAAQAIADATWWIGYCEKASSSYATVRDKSAFTANAGSANYTYFGNLWGLQAQPWCAMFVSTVILESCNSDKTSAKAVLHGLLPYTACNQLYDAAPTAYKGRSKYYGGSWKPEPGDVVVFTQNSQRVHTGFVESASSTVLNTIEGNVGDKVNRKSYSLSSSYIWGYVRPLYVSATTGKDVTGGNADVVGAEVSVTLNELKNGCSGAEVKALQRLLYSRYGSVVKVDGSFGSSTETYVKKAQVELGVTNDGVVGKNTWTALLTKMD